MIILPCGLSLGLSPLFKAQTIQKSDDRHIRHMTVVLFIYTVKIL